MTVGYSEQDDRRLPGPNATDMLKELQLELTRQFSGHERLVAVETGSGNRRFHIYRDPSADAQDPIDQVVAAWRDGVTDVLVESDPGWRQVQQFRV